LEAREFELLDQANYFEMAQPEAVELTGLGLLAEAKEPGAEQQYRRGNEPPEEQHPRHRSHGLRNQDDDSPVAIAAQGSEPDLGGQGLSWIHGAQTIDSVPAISAMSRA
jgi:hypothetical protein